MNIEETSPPTSRMVKKSEDGRPGISMSMLPKITTAVVIRATTSTGNQEPDEPTQRTTIGSKLKHGITVKGTSITEKMRTMKNKSVK